MAGPKGGADLAAGRVDGELAVADGSGGLRPGVLAGAAEDDAGAGGKFPAAEGLGDVVVGAHAQADELVDLVVAGGQQDHRYLAGFAQAAQHLVDHEHGGLVHGYACPVRAARVKVNMAPRPGPADRAVRAAEVFAVLANRMIRGDEGR